ncbi:MAG: hypothetical protein OXG91_10405 [bacterium]|nr:hypothetical protein [bacterium]
MTTIETDRIELHNELAEAIGPVATKLMQHLPPDWTQLATKTDLAALEARIDGRFGKIDGQFEKIDGQFKALRGEMEGMEGRIAGQIAKFALPIVLTLTGLGLTVLGLTITLIIVGPLTGTA